jgi:hypothetical protein
LVAGSGCGAAATKQNRPPVSAQRASFNPEYAAAKRRFIAEEEAICRPAVVRLSRLRSRIGPLADVPRARAKRSAKLIVQEIKLENADFKRMEPPSEPPSDVPLISLWLRSLRVAAADGDEFAEALYTGGSASAETRSEYRVMMQANAYDRKLARAYGFDYCSKLQ